MNMRWEVDFCVGMAFVGLAVAILLLWLKARFDHDDDKNQRR